MIKLAFVLFFVCLFGCSSQRSTPEDASYVAAVVEFQVSSDVEDNLRRYVQFIQDAAQQDADVVVFPEMTLTRSGLAVPVPIKGDLVLNPVPALRQDLYDEILVNISAAARQHEIYVVINVQEIMNCTVTRSDDEYCPEERVYYFNTNVVFDRTGAVIDRYRKINLFGEYTRSPALQPDLGVFTTDFGVTFGHFVCFDLMFQVPAIQVVEKLNITDVIFSTMWFSEMPYLTAVEIQESYAYSLNVNFIASGANNVNVGSAGSGIYSGRTGALVSIMPGVPSSRLLVSRVPKVPGQVNFTYPGPIYDNPTDHDSLKLISDPSLPSHVTRLLVQGFQEFTLVDKEVSCKFRVRLEHRNGDVDHSYRAFIQDGSNTYVKRELGVAMCGVVACKNDEPNSCVHRFKSNSIVIQELEIKMTTYKLQLNFTLQCDNVIYFPLSLTNRKFPLNPENFTIEGFIKRTPENSGQEDVQKYDVKNENQNLVEKYVQEDIVQKDDIGRADITFKLNKPQNDLIAFGIWGRLFTKDVDHNKGTTQEDINNYLEMENIIYGLKDVTDEMIDKYRAAAFSGIRSFSGVETGGSRNCAVFACSGDTIDTCGVRFPQYVANSTAIFSELHIEATVPTPQIDSTLEAHDSAFFPITLQPSIMPLEPSDFEYRVVESTNETVYHLTLTNESAELYTFAVWGRVFEWDRQEASPPIDHDLEDQNMPGSSSVMQKCLILLLISTLFSGFLF